MAFSRIAAAGARTTNATMRPLSTASRSLGSLRVAGVPEHFNAPFHIANERGLYEKEGVKFEWLMVPQGTGAMAQALENDEADVAVMLSEGAVAKVAAGAPLKVIGTYVQSPLRWGIHVKKGAPLKTISDLKGRMFGVSRMLSGSHLMAHVLAHQQGWNAEVDAPLNIVHTLDGAREAMGKGEIDVWLWEKFTTKHLVDSGEWDIVGEIPTPWPCFSFCASDRALAEKGDEIRAVVDTTRKITEEFKANKDGATLRYVSENHKLNLADSEEWLSGTQWACSLQVDEATLFKTQEALIQIGQLDKKVGSESLIGGALCHLKK